MVDWIKNFFIPLVEMILIIGIAGGFAFIIIRAFRKTWKTQTKWFIRYKILRKKYPEDCIKWILTMINNGIGYYDTKKMLLVQGIAPDRINGVMWIYDQILNEIIKENKKSGGIKNVRSLKRNNRKIEGTATDFPKIK